MTERLYFDITLVFHVKLILFPFRSEISIFEAENFVSLKDEIFFLRPESWMDQPCTFVRIFALGKAKHNVYTLLNFCSLESLKLVDPQPLLGRVGFLILNKLDFTI